MLTLTHLHQDTASLTTDAIIPVSTVVSTAHTALSCPPTKFVTTEILTVELFDKVLPVRGHLVELTVKSGLESKGEEVSDCALSKQSPVRVAQLPDGLQLFSMNGQLLIVAMKTLHRSTELVKSYVVGLGFGVFEK